MKRIVLLIVLLNLSIASFFAGLVVGSVGVTLEDLVHALSGDVKSSMDPTNVKCQIIRDVRFPRTVAAYFGGASLALSGLLLQTYFRNPLAGPYVLGISSAASFGVALYILSGIGIGYYGLVGSALVGSVVAIILVLAIASRVRSATTLLIIGLMLGYVFGALERILMTFAESEAVHEFVLWTFESFSGVAVEDIPVIFFASLAVFLSAIFLAKPLNALLMGEDYAKSMGVNVKLARIVIVVLSSFSTAVITAFAGIIAFVGLAIPHIVRLIFRTSDHRVIIPAVIVCGALITVLCDIVSRTIIAPVELPISVTTSLFGAPVVVSLLIRRKRIS